MRSVDQENEAVLALIQAMIGAISTNFRRVSLSIAEDAIQLQFVLCTESPEDRAEISDVELVFESLFSRPIDVSLEIVIDTKPLSEIPALQRVVFARKSS